MADIDAEVEESMKRSRALMEESNRLAAAAREEIQKTAAWREANALPPGIEQRLFARLPEEEKKKLQAERDQYEIEMKRDLETVAERLSPPIDQGAAGKRKRMRNMV